MVAPSNKNHWLQAVPGGAEATDATALKTVPNVDLKAAVFQHLMSQGTSAEIGGTGPQTARQTTELGNAR